MPPRRRRLDALHLAGAVDLTGKPDGDYAFAVRATDTAGNTSQAGTTTYHLARVPGAVDLRTGPGRVGNDRRPRWTFNVAGGSNFVCAMTSPTGAPGNPVACGSPWTADLRGRPDRSYSLTVTAGNGHAPVTQTYELDSTAPAKPTLDAAPVSPAAKRDPAWHFSGEDGAALDCRVSRGGGDGRRLDRVQQPARVRPERAPPTATTR